VYNPEFIAQGSIIKDLTHADMVLIGGDNTEVLETLSEIYKKIQVTKPVISIMSSTAAEIVKIAVNCFMTTKISFANMIGEVLILSGLEDEIESVLASIASDSRIGSKYLKFGFGFGGPC
ncbi:MAG: UDP-glucose/GDP-mannose dehydrogenase family protein, partial [bacterium]